MRCGVERDPNLNIWSEGCPNYAKNVCPNELEARSTLCKFIWYPKNLMGYVFYDTKKQNVYLSTCYLLSFNKGISYERN